MYIYLIFFFSGNCRYSQKAIKIGAVKKKDIFNVPKQLFEEFFIWFWAFLMIMNYDIINRLHICFCLVWILFIFNPIYYFYIFFFSRNFMSKWSYLNLNLVQLNDFLTFNPERVIFCDFVYLLIYDLRNC